MPLGLEVESNQETYSQRKVYCSIKQSQENMVLMEGLPKLGFHLRIRHAHGM